MYFIKLDNRSKLTFVLFLVFHHFYNEKWNLFFLSVGKKNWVIERQLQDVFILLLQNTESLCCFLIQNQVRVESFGAEYYWLLVVHKVVDLDVAYLDLKVRHSLLQLTSFLLDRPSLTQSTIPKTEILNRNIQTFPRIVINKRHTQSFQCNIKRITFSLQYLTIDLFLVLLLNLS